MILSYVCIPYIVNINLAKEAVISIDDHVKITCDILQLNIGDF